MQANSGDPDQTPHSVVSDLGLHYLPMSHEKDQKKAKWLKIINLIRVPEIWEVDCWNNLLSESALGTSIWLE